MPPNELRTVLAIAFATAATGHEPLASRQSAQLILTLTQKTTTFPTSKLKRSVACKFTLARYPCEPWLTAKATSYYLGLQTYWRTPVFAGNSRASQTLIEYLEGGETIDDFLQGFPTVTPIK